MYESKRSIYDEAEATQKSYDPMSMIYEIAKVALDARGLCWHVGACGT